MLSKRGNVDLDFEMDSILGFRIDRFGGIECIQDFKRGIICRLEKIVSGTILVHKHHLFLCVGVWVVLNFQLSFQTDKVNLVWTIQV